MVRLTWLATTCICAAFSILYLLARDPGRVAGGFAAGNSSSSSSSSSRSDPVLQMPFGAFAFEVHGRVQGVWFRKFTVAKAQALHLVGWCANSQRGTVMGECQGKPEDLEVMKEWLCTEGSPHSHIERCDFKRERSIQQLEYEVFERRPNVP